MLFKLMLFSVCITSFIFVSTVGYSLQGNQLIDLSSNIPSEFANDVMKWTINNSIANSYSKCNDTLLFPGYGVLTHSTNIETSYDTSAVVYNTIGIFIKFWIIGNWSYQDHISFMVTDRPSLTAITFSDTIIKTQLNNSLWLSSTCNGSVICNVLPVAANVIVKHAGNYLGFRFKSVTLSPTAFYGIREIKVLFFNQTNQPANQACGSTLPSNQLQATTSIVYSGPCRCLSGIIWQIALGTTSLICINCNPACHTCYDFGADHCGTCNTNYVYNGSHCILQCTFPCLTCSPISSTSCLSCEVGYDLNANQCLPKVANAPSAGRNSTSCSAPNFLYNNGSCLSQCNLPRKVYVNASTNFCEEPCSKTNPYYEPDSKYCLSTCKQPYSIVYTDNYSSCLLQLDPKDVEQIEKVASAGTTAGIVTNTLMAVANLVSPGDPSGISSLMLAKLLQYVKFLDISYPIRLEWMFKKNNSTAGAIIPGLAMNDQLKSKFELKSIPYKFAKYAVHSDFLVNFWNSLLTLTVIVGVLYLIHILELIVFKIKNKLHPSIKKVRLLIQNVVIMQIYNSAGDIMLFSCLALPTTNVQTLIGCVSFFVAIYFIAFETLLFFKHFRILYQYQSIKKVKENATSELLENFKKKNEGFQVFFETFKDESLPQQSYLLFLVLKGVIFNMVLVFLFEHPLIQTIIILVLSIGMCCYMTLARSYKKAVNWLQHLTYEIILLVANISLLIMAIQDDKGLSPTSSTATLGEIIIICNLVFSFLPSVFLVVKIILAVREFLIQRKLNSKKAEEEKEPVTLPEKDISIAGNYLVQTNLKLRQARSNTSFLPAEERSLDYKSYTKAKKNQNNSRLLQSPFKKPSLDSSSFINLNQNASFAEDLPGISPENGKPKFHRESHSLMYDFPISSSPENKIRKTSTQNITNLISPIKKVRSRQYS